MIIDNKKKIVFISNIYLNVKYSISLDSPLQKKFLYVYKLSLKANSKLKNT